MILSPLKCEFMGFGNTNGNEAFTYREIRPRKIINKKLSGIPIGAHLNVNEHITNVCKGVSRKLNALLSVSYLLSYQQKKFV